MGGWVPMQPCPPPSYSLPAVSGGQLFTVMPVMHGVFCLIKYVERLGHGKLWRPEICSKGGGGGGGAGLEP